MHYPHPSSHTPARWLPLAAVLLLAACGNGGNSESAAGIYRDGAPPVTVQKLVTQPGTTAPAEANEVADTAQVPRGAPNTLAYAHSVALTVPETKVAPLAAQLQTTCRELPDARCTVLSSAVRGGDYPGATLQLRATPADIITLKHGLAGAGEVVSESTSAEDLAEQMTDTAKRLDMLLAYRKQLEQLRGRAANDIAALLQVQRELAQVQADIEQATGQKTYFQRRVSTEILNVEIASESAASGLQPVREATTHFLENLAAAAGGVISAIAFLLPWAAFLTLVWWVVRPMRRWWQARRAAKKPLP